MREAVVGGFSGDVGHVDALAECVAADGCFGRGDAQALREDATEIGATGAVPEEAAVATFGVGEGGVGESAEFAGTLDAEDVLDLYVRVSVSQYFGG